MPRSTPQSPLAYLDARQAELRAMCPPKEPVSAPAKELPSEKIPRSDYCTRRRAELDADRAKRAAVFPSHEDLARHAASLDLSWAAVLNP